MTGKTSTGSTQAATGAVDAHAANEFDIRHGLAGAEAKPFREAQSPGEPASETRKEGDGLPAQHRSDANRNQQGLVERPTGQFPPSGQQGAGADRRDDPGP